MLITDQPLPPLYFKGKGSNSSSPRRRKSGSGSNNNSPDRNSTERVGRSQASDALEIRVQQPSPERQQNKQTTLTIPTGETDRLIINSGQSPLEPTVSQRSSFSNLNARGRFQALGRAVIAQKRLSAPVKMRKMLNPALGNSPGPVLPFIYTAKPENAEVHAYFTSSDPAFNAVLGDVNDQINSEPKLQSSLEHQKTSQKLKLELFPYKAPNVEEAYEKLQESYSEVLFPILAKTIKSGDNEFRKRRGGDSTPIQRLNRVLENEMAVTSTSCAPLQVNKLLKELLGYKHSRNFKDLNRRKALVTWRAQNAAQYLEKKALAIMPTWKEWGYSVGISTVWSALTEVLGKNGYERLLFLNELKGTDYKHLPEWRKLVVGIPEHMLSTILESTSGGKKFAAIGGRVAGQGSAEIPDVILVQVAIKRVAKNISFNQALKEVVKEKKWETLAAVIAASVGTMPEKARELLWNPTTTGGKVGNALTKTFVTNPLSVLSCGLPFFTEGGPQAVEASKLLAKAYNPETGIFNLTDAELTELTLKGRTLKDVKKFFDRKADKEILHSSPAPKMVAASIPLAVLYSLIPSAVESLSSGLISKEVLAEIVQAGISFGQVPVFGPIELLASNTAAGLNKRFPGVVTGLSKIGRPVINFVYTPFSYGKRVISDGISFARGKKPENPYEDYKAVLNTLHNSPESIV